MQTFLVTLLKYEATKDWRISNTTQRTIKKKEVTRERSGISKKSSDKGNGKRDFILEMKGTMQGARFASSLIRGGMMNMTVSSAVDEWIIQSPSLVKVDATYPFFRPFVEKLMQFLQGASKTIKIRLAIAVLVTYIDQATDVIVMVSYFQNPDSQDSFMGMLTVFILHMCVDLFWIATWKRGNPTAMRREMLLRIFWIKPITDLAKIFNNSPPDHGCLVDPMREFVETKQVEVIFECVPQTFIQAKTLISVAAGGGETTAQIISLIVTFLTTGFNQAVSSVITDTEPAKRKQDQNFLGYVPNSPIGRLIIFFSLWFSTSIYNALRCIAYTLLFSSVGPIAFFVFLIEFTSNVSITPGLLSFSRLFSNFFNPSISTADLSLN